MEKVSAKQLKRIADGGWPIAKRFEGFGFQERYHVRVFAMTKKKFGHYRRSSFLLQLDFSRYGQVSLPDHGGYASYLSLQIERQSFKLQV